MRPPTRRENRLVGFSYDARSGIARFSMYVPGTAGRERKRATVRADSRDEAIRLWSAFRGRATAGFRRASPEAPTFREFIDEHFSSIAANVSPKTARDYRYVIERHLLPALGALSLDEITSGVLNQLGARLKTAGYAGATVNNYVNVARVMLGYAVEFDVIEELPLKKRIKKQKANQPCLELVAEERARFLAAFDDESGFQGFLRQTMPKAKRTQSTSTRFGGRRAHGAGMRDDGEAARAYFARYRSSKDLFVVALETGIRSGDLRRLRIRNVNLVDGWIRFFQQKTGHEAVIPISRQCRIVLERRLGDRDREPDAYVFVTESGLPYGDSTMKRYFRIAKRIAGITRRLRIHDLRHSFGSDLATAGVPLRFISKVMGHTNTATTARYARPDPIVLERVREALDRER